MTTAKTQWIGGGGAPTHRVIAVVMSGGAPIYCVFAVVMGRSARVHCVFTIVMCGDSRNCCKIAVDSNTPTHNQCKSEHRNSQTLQKHNGLEQPTHNKRKNIVDWNPPPITIAKTQWIGAPPLQSTVL